VKRALLLNADWSPLRFISDRSAVRLFMNGRAEVIQSPVSDGLSFWNDEGFATVSTVIAIPATLKLCKYVSKRWQAPRFRKKVLYRRDGWRCQYCGEKLSWNNITIDHVLPSSRGGQTSWLNCVTACKHCNKRKANRTPEEAGMVLAKKPANPSALHFWDVLKTDCWHIDWEMFLGSLKQ